MYYLRIGKEKYFGDKQFILVSGPSWRGLWLFLTCFYSNFDKSLIYTECIKLLVFNSDTVFEISANFLIVLIDALEVQEEVFSLLFICLMFAL